MLATVARGQLTYIVDDDKGLGPSTIVMTDGMEDATSNNGREQLFNEEGQEDRRNGRQVEVVDQEKSLELEGLAVAHELSTAENDSVVDQNEYARLFQCRHGRDTWHELELIRRIPGERSPCLVEDGP